MRYEHIISAFAAEPWAMQREKLEAITRFMAFKARGGHLSPLEVQANIEGRRDGAAARAAGDVMILPVYGVMSQRASMLQDISGGASTEQIGAAFRAAVADDSVRAIVMDYDSPGGSTFGVEDLASEIRAARGVKPIIAQVNSLCASAAYWIACQADEIVVTPGGVAGSIGVYAVHEDISEMLANDGIKPTLIRGRLGPNKAELNGLGPLSDNALAALQERIDQAEASFVADVAAGRGVSTSAVVSKFGGGRVFNAEELVSRGMADRVAPLRDTLARLGSAPPRPNAAGQSRQAFAKGDNPTLAQIEDVLRDAGFPNALAVAFVSHGKGALRSESGPETEPTPIPDPEARASFDRLMARIGGKQD